MPYFPSNLIEKERKMAETYFEQALAHLKSVNQTSPLAGISLQLRFLRTFIKCAAKRCFEYDSLPNVLTRIRNLALLVRKLPLISYTEQEVAKVQEKLNRLQPEVEQLYLFITQNSPVYKILTWLRYYPLVGGENEGDRDKEFFKFLSFIREDMRLLIHKRSYLIDVLKNNIEILYGKLIYIEGILTVTSDICPGHERRHQLFRHFKSIADTAAYLSYCCLADNIDEDRVHRLALQYSQLTMKIEPSTLDVRKLYVQVLEVPRLWPGSQEGYTYPTVYPAETFVKVLVHLAKEILKSNCDWTMNMKDRLEILHVELRSFPYMGAHYNKEINEVNTAAEAGCFLFSNYNKEINGEAISDVQLALNELLKSMKLSKLQVRNVTLDKTLPPQFPKTDELGFFDSFMGSLNEILGHKSIRNIFWGDHFQLIQRDLAALRSFLSEASDNKNQDEEVEQIRRKVIHVAYEAEYAIDSVLLTDSTPLHHKLWISDVIEKIKQIKAETNSIHSYDNPDIKEDSEEMDEREEYYQEISKEETQLNIIKEDRQIVCFDEEESLYEFLLARSKGTEIVFITGMAGQGKSTLASKVFDDLSLRKKFDVCVWCTVSQVYDKKSILIKLIKMENGCGKIDEGVPRKSYDDLVQLLNQRLKQRKYLIFLDDIWDIGAWNALKRSFPKSADSKILFTTRSEDIPYKVDRNSKIILLQPLCHNKSLELLNMKLFGNESCPVHLKNIRDQIAWRCKGLPLAIQLVAGILRGNTDLHLWNEVAKSPNSYIVDDCKGVLDLSYNRLPDTLKPCFLYFGAFQEDEVIASKKLIWLWIAEGFIRKTNEKSLEHIAEDCLNDLISRNLIKLTSRRSRGGIKEVSIHDLVHKYCLDQSEHEKFLHLLDPSPPPSSYMDPTSYTDRRLAMHFERHDTSWCKSHFPLVRTLLFSATQSVGNIQLTDVLSICRGCKLLRVLDLMCINLDGNIPSAVYSLAYLKYLSICGVFDRLPESISKLSNLETLLVRTLKKDVGVKDVGVLLPRSFVNLIKLRHLHISNWFVLSREITILKLLEKLENLESISTALFPFGSLPEKGMKRFPKVKKLKYMFCESEYTSKLPLLDIVTELESLNVSYCGNGKLRPTIDISFPACIKKLTLSGFRLPWEKISVLEELPNLEVLKLLHKAFEGITWSVKDNMFPKLKFLKLEGLDIESWKPSVECEDDSYFPFLEQVELRSCRQLKEILSGLGGEGYLKIIKVQWCSSILWKSIEELQEKRKSDNDEVKVELRR